MGDIADYYILQMISTEFPEEINHSVVVEHIWTCRNGEKIPVSKMTDNHLINTLNMLNKNRTCSWWFDILHKEELRRRLKLPLKGEFIDENVSESDIY